MHQNILNENAYVFLIISFWENENAYINVLYIWRTVKINRMKIITTIYCFNDLSGFTLTFLEGMHKDICS